MSAYENLPVFKAALALAGYFYIITAHFNKRDKYEIGADLCRLSRRVLSLVVKANTKNRRVEKLEQAIEVLEDLKIQVYLCKEVRAFRSIKSFEVSTRKIVDILKQCEGWKDAGISQGHKPQTERAKS